MDSVSVETSPENEWIKQRIVDGKVSNHLKFCLTDKQKHNCQKNLVKSSTNFTKERKKTVNYCYYIFLYRLLFIFGLFSVQKFFEFPFLKFAKPQKNLNAINVCFVI